MQFRQRRLKTCAPNRRTAVRFGWCGARHRWTNRTATFPTTNSTTSKLHGPIRRPSRWCWKVRYKAALNSNWRNWKNGRSTAFGSWPELWSVTDHLPNPSPSEHRKMVRNLQPHMLNKRSTGPKLFNAVSSPLSNQSLSFILSFFLSLSLSSFLISSPLHNSNNSITKDIILNLLYSRLFS